MDSRTITVRAIDYQVSCSGPVFRLPGSRIFPLGPAVSITKEIETPCKIGDGC